MSLNYKYNKRMKQFVHIIYWSYYNDDIDWNLDDVKMYVGYWD